MTPEIRRQTSARRQPRRVTLVLEANDDPSQPPYVVTSPEARGWRFPIRTAADAAAMLHEAPVEVQIARYARAHGQVYDHDAATDVDPETPGTEMPAPRKVKGSRVSAGWEEQDDGTWRSPAGLVFGADTTMVRRVIAAREREEAARQAEAHRPPPSPLPPDRG